MVGVLKIDVLVLLFCSDCVRRRAICGNASDVRKHATCKDHFISLLHFITSFHYFISLLHFITSFHW